jgi:ArsR family transcriptional regulator, arsenate/arsenite/antimonite-responsive transcriptional repressor
MKSTKAPTIAVDVAQLADMMAALGNESRLRIVRLLLSAHPEGLVVGDVQDELGIAGSTLSHHLDKLKNEGLVSVRREGTFLRYAVNTESLRSLLTFLYAECCGRSRAVDPADLIRTCRC